jgi:hypothetical protein
MDVINAAKMISECGSKLNKLAKDIAAQVNHKNLLTKKNHRNLFFNSVLNHNQNLILVLMLIVRNSLNFFLLIHSSLLRYHSLLSSIGYNE